MRRHDYIPYGEEIPAGTAGRTNQWGATKDTIPTRFTGQLRDPQTNLDWFNTRSFEAAAGRFLSPDPANAGADITHPQSWNAYAYVLGNPLANLDPSGLDRVTFDNGTTGDDGQGTACAGSQTSQTITVYDGGDSSLNGVDTFSGGGTSGARTPSSVFTTIAFGKQYVSTVATPRKNRTAQRLSCAANFGQNHSIAAAFGAQNKFAANLFGGNSVSGLVNLGLFLSGAKTPTASQLAAIPLKGAAQGIPVPPDNPGLSGAVGQVRGLAIQGGVSAAYNAFTGAGAVPIELGLTAARTIATPVAQLGTQTLTNIVTGVGVAKSGLDLGTFLYGLTVVSH